MTTANTTARGRIGGLPAVDGRAVAEHPCRMGVWVMIFLGVFTIVAWRLNAAFWKDIK
jgi:hypothetical protein